VGSAVEKSYNRSNYIDERKSWLERWSEHCRLGQNGNVVQLTEVSANG